QEHGVAGLAEIAPGSDHHVHRVGARHQRTLEMPVADTMAPEAELGTRAPAGPPTQGAVAWPLLVDGRRTCQPGLDVNRALYDSPLAPAFSHDPRSTDGEGVTAPSPSPCSAPCPLLALAPSPRPPLLHQPRDGGEIAKAMGMRQVSLTERERKLPR